MNVDLFSKAVQAIGLLLTLSCTILLGASAARAELDAGPVQLAANSFAVDYEASLLPIIRVFTQGDLGRALLLTDQHLNEFPKSQVGQLIRADVLNAMSAQEPLLDPATAQQSKQLIGLRHQIKSRWLHDQVHQAVAAKLVPANLVMMGKHKYVLVADLQFGRLYLYQNNNGQASLIKDYYLSVGKAGFGKQVEGDNKTPVGVYSIIKHIEGVKLPDLYGKGAFPIDYPNRYDKSLRRTGYGIWLHGTPSDTYARAPWSSEGCFVLSNDDLLDIQQYLDVDSRPPVILSDSIEWIDAAELGIRRRGYLQVIANWKSDLESLDIQAYLTHYSPENLNFGGVDYDSWAKRKISQNKSKSFVQIVLNIDSLFIYPGSSDIFIVKFKQHYLSNNFVGEIDTEQYWQRDSVGQWRIIYES
jgi:murein L,D-transpeptidase YafK